MYAHSKSQSYTSEISRMFSIDYTSIKNKKIIQWLFLPPDGLGGGSCGQSSGLAEERVFRRGSLKGTPAAFTPVLTSA